MLTCVHVLSPISLHAPFLCTTHTGTMNTRRCAGFLMLHACVPMHRRRELGKAVGCLQLERQLDDLGSCLHVYGHTHVDTDMCLPCGRTRNAGAEAKTAAQASSGQGKASTASQGSGTAGGQGKQQQASVSSSGSQITSTGGSDASAPLIASFSSSLSISSSPSSVSSDGPLAQAGPEAQEGVGRYSVCIPAGQRRYVHHHLKEGTQRLELLCVWDGAVGGQVRYLVDFVSGDVVGC